MVFKKEYLECIGDNFAEVLFAFSKNAATTVLLIENIAENLFYKINIRGAISEIEKVMFATNFIEVLPPEYTEGLEAELLSKRFYKMREGFYGDYLRNIPILFGHKIYPKKVSASKKEIQSIHKSCCCLFLERNNQNEDKEEFIKSTVYEFYETLSFLNSRMKRIKVHIH